ncbi:hypothetical protein VTJ83DRAFT_1448 [Remersonia thermophila]|uniref:Zn(2)-C6 fungal-type domain-containing protein n=1 Tax=Remersonia thermophila TaxID=72144 RepID=A0ABR4DP29_9PEZI
MSDQRSASHEATSIPRASVPKACDACRARKIRCNRELPCAHCRDAKVECHRSGARPQEKRARILLTHQYEQKIDSIDRRLDGVVRLLEELKTQWPTSGRLPPVTVHSSTASSPAVPPDTQSAHSCQGGNLPEATASVAEGASSLTAQSVFANDVLKKVVSSNAKPEMHQRIEALSSMVESLKQQPVAQEMTYPRAKPVPQSVPFGCELPPIAKTLEVLKLSKAYGSIWTAWVLELFRLDLNEFPTICIAAYMDSSSEYNAANFITVSFGLHYLFSITGCVFEDKRDEYFALSRLCAGNLETALAALPLHLPASYEVILALAQGAFYSIELCKPSLTWTLCSKASELCQSLGYHRLTTFKSEPAHVVERKQFLFWAIYALDKSLSLRLGRSSSIQDHDITIPNPGSMKTVSKPAFSALDLWVKVSRIQGQIYELLYCPDALAQPEDVRKSQAQQLASSLDEVDKMTAEATAQCDWDFRGFIGDDLTEFFVLSDDVLRLSTRTLIYRSCPNPPGSPTTFTPECIQTARETLARHQQCMAIIDRSLIPLFSIYMSWTIQYAPFVPFIVVFCQVIETQDRADLARLEAFVASLQPYPSDTDAVERLRRLFQALCTVASHYIESQTRVGHDDRASNLVASLGFPASFAPTGQPDAGHAANLQGSSGNAFQRGANPMMWVGNGMELEDWFYNNEQMMHLLDDGFLEG